MFASQKDGISALSLQRSLEIGSYATAWAMLHRLRSVLVRPGRDRLGGTVEVDETYFGSEEPGLRGGRQKGKKVLIGIAVERKEPKGYGRCRMAILGDGSASSLHPFVTAHVEPGATVVTDGWPSYRGIDKLGYVHEPHSQRAASAAGRTSERSCQASTGLRSSPSAGTSAPIKAVPTRRTSRATSTSSPSASTDAVREAEGWCSIGSYNSPSSTTRSDSGNWSPIHSQRRCRRYRLADGLTRRAWIARERTDRGEP
jgi:hypothetical protein